MPTESPDCTDHSTQIKSTKTFDRERLHYLVKTFDTCKQKINAILQDPKILTIKVDLQLSMVRISGDNEQRVIDAYKDLNSLLESFVVGFRVKDELFLKTLTETDGSVIESLWSRKKIFAGWDVREDKLFICSDSLSSIDAAFDVADQTIKRSQYPVNGSLSPYHKSLLKKGKYENFVQNLKLSVPSLVLEFNNETRVINVAFHGETVTDYVHWALDTFFTSNGMFTAFSIVQLSSLQFELMNKNRYLVEKGLETKTGSVEISLEHSTCKIMCASMQLLSRTKENLQNVLYSARRKTISITHAFLNHWLISKNSIQKLEYINTLCDSVSKLSMTSSTKKCNQRSIVSTPNTDALGWLFENWKVMHLYKPFRSKVKLEMVNERPTLAVSLLLTSKTCYFPEKLFAA